MPEAAVRFPFSPLIPGAYSILDASALQASELIEGAPVVAVIGACAGGKPNTPLYLRGPGALKNVARSGAAYDVARAAFIGGAQQVTLVRAGAPTQSVAALAGATSTPVTLTSLDYGAWTSTIRRQVQANNLLTISYTGPDGVKYTENFACGASATPQQIVDAVNGKNPTMPGSKFVGAAVTTGATPLTVVADAALPTAGTDGSALAGGDWTTALQKLEAEEVDLLCVATGDATVHAQAITHANLMSHVSARKERTVINGGVKGESTAAAAARITGALIDKRSQLVYPGGYLFAEDGTLTLYDPFVIAGLTAGKHASREDVATSLLGVELPELVDVESRLSSIPGGDQEILLAAGVTPIAPRAGGGFEYVDSLSGYKADGSFRDLHKIRTADFTQKRLRTNLQASFKGRKTLPGIAGEIKLAAEAELTDLVTEEILVAHQGAEVVQDAGDPRTFAVNAWVVLPDTTKFILLTVALVPPTAQTA